MSHPQQMRNGVTEGCGFSLAKAPHHPLKLQNDREWYENRCGLHHDAPGYDLLARGFGVIRIVAIEASEHIGVDCDRVLRRGGLSRSAESNSDSRRLQGKWASPKCIASDMHALEFMALNHHHFS
jgi:hypothetical protein